MNKLLRRSGLSVNLPNSNFPANYPGSNNEAKVSADVNSNFEFPVFLPPIDSFNAELRPPPTPPLHARCYPPPPPYSLAA